MTTSPRHWAFNPPPVSEPDAVQPSLLPRAQQALIVAICRRAAGPHVDLVTSDWPLGGVELWTRATGSGLPLPEQRAWVLHHRMERQLALVGWHTEADARRLLVLGWSLSALRHRARMLQGALTRLAVFDVTAYRAAALTGDLLCGLCPPGQDEREYVVDRTRALIARELRWPARLAEIATYDRTSEVERMQLALAQIVGLEGKVARACQEHLLLAARVSEAVCEHAVHDGDLDLARMRALAEAEARLRATPHPDTPPGGDPTASEPPADEPERDDPLMGLAERRVAASTPNRPPADVPPTGG